MQVTLAQLDILDTVESLAVPDGNPVRSTIARTLESIGIEEGFKKPQSVMVSLEPIVIEYANILRKDVG